MDHRMVWVRLRLDNSAVSKCVMVCATFNEHGQITGLCRGVQFNRGLHEFGDANPKALEVLDHHQEIIFKNTIVIPPGIQVENFGTEVI